MSEMHLQLDSGERLSVRRFEVEESASSLFCASVWARSESPTIDLDALVGRGASLRVVHGTRFVAGGGTRTWVGVCSHAEQAQAETTGLSTYHLRIVPRLYLLTQRTNYRVYQHMSIPDIVQSVLADARVPHRWRVAREGYPKLELKVQYGESDFAFVSRLLEEAGISFVFTDWDGQGSELTLDDALPSREERPLLPYADNPNQAAEREFVTRVRLSHEVRPGAFVLRDFDFRRPSYPLFAEAPRVAGAEAAYERYHYQPGSFLIEQASGGDTPVADDQGAARHVESYGNQRATRALAATRVGRRSVTFDTNALDLCPGSVVRIGLHPHQELSEDARLLVLESRIQGSHDGEWLSSARAVFAAEAYAPLLRTRKPVVSGVQSAT
ncbi:MAG: type VI secretion system tip protein VgrG, partial [Myxococcales bacterium]|nr:type VI secretion system tip protein VgrG [Myxococcales bacterium]